MKLVVAVLAALALAASFHTMRDQDIYTTLLAELAKRHPPASLVQEQEAEETRLVNESTRMADQLREFYYPKQRAFFRSRSKCKATCKTRRAGATTGGCRELLARAIEMPGFRATYVTTTRNEAKTRAWITDTQSGLVDIIRQFGSPIKHPTLESFRLGGVTVIVRDGDLVLDFSNGSQINLFGADKLKDLRKERGHAKHVYWIDEAQDFPNLEKFYDAVVIGSLTDFDGECWISGTPGQDCAGFFYEITKNEDADDPRLPGWDVHTIAVVDNPYFGRVVQDSSSAVAYYVQDNTGNRTGPYDTQTTAEEAAVKIRWDRTAGEALRKKGWKGDEPDFIREWLGRWVKSDARYVYPVHSVPKHLLVYAPQRLIDNPINALHARWYNHQAAMADLPRNGQRAYEWLFAIGADFGYAQTPFALTMWAFTFARPDIFEMLSWKQHKVLPDDQRLYLEDLWRSVPNIVALAGDPAGQKAADLEAWRTRFSLPIDDADKSAKNTWQELMAGDIRKYNVHYRGVIGEKGTLEPSPLLHEHMHLVYLPTKPGKTRKDDEFRRISDGTVPGNDCSDGGLYAYRYMQHHLFRDKPKDPRTQQEQQEDEHEQRIDRMTEIAQAMRDRGELEEYGFDGGYEW